MSVFRRVCSALALATLVAGPLSAAEKEKITLVFSHPNMAPGEEVFMYAVPKAMGYFDAENLDVSYQAASGGAQAAQVMLSGRAQFSTTMAEGVLQLREQGAKPVAFYELKRNNGFSVGIPKDSPIKTLADLKGKSIGFPVAGGGTKMIVDESFRAAGVDPAYTQVVVGSGAPAAAAVRNKQVDAIVLWDAAFGIIENLGIELNYLELPIQDKLAGMSLVASGDYLANNKDVAARFCRAVAKGLHYTLSNREAAINLMFKEFPTTLPPNVDKATATKQALNVLDKWLGSAQKGLPYGEKTGEVKPERWDFTAKRYTEVGMLKADKPDGAYETALFAPCNDFDRAAVAAQAKEAK